MDSEPQSANLQEVGAPTRPQVRSNFRSALFRYEGHKADLGMGLRNAAGVTIPLFVGWLTNQLNPALIAALGALNVSYADGRDPYRARGRRMLLSSVACAAAVFAGARLSHSPVGAILLIGLWSFSAGMLVSLGATAADLGNISLVTLIVFAARPLNPRDAALSSFIALCGSLLQTGLSLAAWPVRGLSPERKVLGSLYTQLASLAESHDATPPPASEQITAAQQALAGLSGDHSVEAERYVSILNQAERIRLSIIALLRLRSRLRGNSDTTAAVEIVDRALHITFMALAAYGRCLSLAADFTSLEPVPLDPLQDIGQALRVGEQTAPSQTAAAFLKDCRTQIEALAGQLRTVRDLVTNTTDSGDSAFRGKQQTTPWRLRLSGAAATLRANFTLRSPACRHAVRLMVCVAVAETISRSQNWHRWYWIPMTVAIVLKPDFKSTFSRGTLRLAGTIIGLVLATVMFHLVPANMVAVHIVLIGVFTFLLRSFGQSNYGIFVIALSALIVVLVALSGVSPGEVILSRGLNTFIGGTLALLAYWLWPTREEKHISDAIAEMLDAYRAYFHTVREAYVGNIEAGSRLLDDVRLQSRLARSRLEASIDRLSAEPNVSAEKLQRLTGMLASSHRLVHAIMALEAGLTDSVSAPVRGTFVTFANHAEVTLHTLAAALRGSKVETDDLPNLREDHHCLISSGSPEVERYALVNVEADRIANSLNTLSGQILKRAQSGQGVA